MKNLTGSNFVARSAPFGKNAGMHFHKNLVGSKMLKIFGAIFFVFVLALIALGVLVSQLIKPDEIKPIISNYVYKTTGRTLTFEGDVKLSFFPTLSFDVGKTTLSNLKNFEGAPFVKVDDAKISIKLLPLLHKKIETEKLILNGLTVNLITNKEGISNWKNLKSEDAQTTAASDAAQEKTTQKLQFDIKEISLKNSAIYINDEAVKQKIHITNLNFTAKDIQEKAEFPVKASFDIKNDKPKMDGKITINFTGKMDTEKNQYQIKNLIFNADLFGNTLPNKEMHLALKSDILATKETIEIKPLELKLNNDVITGFFGIDGIGKFLKMPNFFTLMQTTSINGQLSSNKLNLPSLQLNNVRTNLNSKNGILNVSPISATIYGGALTAAAKINFQKQIPQISINSEISNFDVNPITKDLFNSNKFAGIGTIKADITANSFDQQTMLKTLNGQIKVNIKQGVLKGIDIGYLIHSGISIARKEIPTIKIGGAAANQTNFSHLSGSGFIKNGILTNNDLLLLSDAFKANGAGTINLVSRNINYNIDAMLLDKRDDWAVPIIISGNFDNPKISVDTAKILAQFAKQELQHITKGIIPGKEMLKSPVNVLKGLEGLLR